jgi:hypothetical protein
MRGMRLVREAGSGRDEQEAELAADQPPRGRGGTAELGDALSCHAAPEGGVRHHADQLLNVDYLHIELLEVEA